MRSPFEQNKNTNKVNGSSFIFRNRNVDTNKEGMGLKTGIENVMRNPFKS